MKRNGKIIILEGLPGVGKTYLLNEIAKRKENVIIVEELINGEIPPYELQEEQWFLDNDDKKMAKIKDGLTIIDRGPISTLSYNQTRKITDEGFLFDLNIVLMWFQKYTEILNSDNVFVYYLTNNQIKFSITSPYKTDPYGAIENQKLLEKISLYNCKKFAKNVKIKYYDQSNLEEIINEIIN